jgi:hypothetical protein
MRSLLFVIWIKSAKDAATALSIIETLALGEFDTQSRGGARIVSANVAGKQFQYELPADWSATDFIEQLRLLYKVVTTGGASGGQMTDAEMEAYVIDAGNQVTNVAKARFADEAGGRDN